MLEGEIKGIESEGDRLKQEGRVRERRAAIVYIYVSSTRILHKPSLAQRLCP